MKNSVTAGEYTTTRLALIQLGWNLDNDSTARAMDISIEEADKYVDETYHVVITVEEDMTTTWRYVNTKQKINGIDEGSPSEATGDDEQTILDLIELQNSGDIFEIRNY